MYARGGPGASRSGAAALAAAHEAWHALGPIRGSTKELAAPRVHLAAPEWRRVLADQRRWWSAALQRAPPDSEFAARVADLFLGFAVLEDWLEAGVDVPWISAPPRPGARANSRAARQHADAVRAVLREHVDLGALRPTSQRPTVVSPLIAVVQPDKVRPCLDLSALVNEHVRPVSVRYQRLGEIARLADAFGDDVHLAVFDIGSAFLSFRLRPELAQYFGVEWDRQYYLYDTLTFGLSFSPAACALFLTVVQLELWRRGIPCSLYADDFTIVGSGRHTTQQRLDSAAALCRLLGLRAPMRKRQAAARIVTSLGARVDAEARTIELLPERRVKLARALCAAAAAPSLSRSEVRRLCGRLAHASATVLTWARSFSNELYSRTHGPASERVVLDDDARDDLRHWARLVRHWRGARPWRTPQVSHTMISDGSDRGGAFAWESSGPIFGFEWPPAVQPLVAACTPLGEFLAILVGLAVLRPPKGAHVHMRCDASAVVGAINACRGRRSLAAPARWCAQFVRDQQAFLSASHVPGVENFWCDVGSRPGLHRFSAAHAMRAVNDQRAALALPPARARHFVFLPPALVDRACSLFLTRSPSRRFPRWSWR